jgi:hypothetical protein
MKRISIVVLDQTARLIAEYAKDDARTRGQIVDAAMALYNADRNERDNEEREHDA